MNIEDNKLIADFMNLEYRETTYGIFVRNKLNDLVFVDYSKSWNGLMRAVEKIESLDLKDEYYTWEQEGETEYNFQAICVEIERNRCWIYAHMQLDPYYTFSDNTCDSKIEAVYKSVVEFIKIYNEK